MASGEVIFIFVFIIGIIIWAVYCRVGKTTEKRNSPPLKSKSDVKQEFQRPPEKDYSEIDAEIKDVIGWIGISEPVNTSTMFEKVLDGKEKEVINEIASQLSLPMKVTTKYCSEVKDDGNGSAPLAEVMVGNIPRYGSKYLKDYPCVITLYPGYNSKPDRFIYVIAHELCHYILQSLRPRLADSKKEERLTDLAVIFGGFESAYRTGWQSSMHGNAGYYANEFDIEYIRRKYESMLVARRQKFEKLSEDYKELIKSQSDVLLFVKMCALLLAHPSEKITKDDMEAIGKCFILVGKEEIAEINKLSKSLKPLLQKPKRYGEMADNETNLARLAKLLRNIGLPAMEEIAILIKYTDKYV